jgi:hypothetical protein
MLIFVHAGVISNFTSNHLSTVGPPTDLTNDILKVTGIVQPFELVGDTRPIRSAVKKNWKPGKLEIAA